MSSSSGSSSSEIEMEREGLDEDVVWMVPNRREAICQRLQSHKLVFSLSFIILVLSIVILAFIVSGEHTGHEKELRRLRDEVAQLRDANAATTTIPTPNESKKVIRNVIFMISDGMGPASMALARAMKKHKESSTKMPTLNLDTKLVGSVRTYSQSSLVTDSAAGATAYSCAEKSYNGAIAVDSLEAPCGTLLEAARDQLHQSTGLVVTSRLTHATPASFAAHVRARDSEQLIAKHFLTSDVDVLLGGGKKFFSSLIDSYKERNYSVIYDKSALASIETLAKNQRVLGLFGDTHLPYELDRSDDSSAPTLLEMAERAVKLLSNPIRSPNGFFLMIEGSRIDHASHSNDVSAHVGEVLMYDKVFGAMVKFAEQRGDTLVVSVSDHETGGLSLGRRSRSFEDYPPYLFRPKVIDASTHSVEVCAAEVMNAPVSELFTIVASCLKLHNLQEYDRQEISAAREKNDLRLLGFALADALAFESIIGWSTIGHSGADIPLFVAGDPNAGTNDALIGNVENTFVGNYVATLMGIDLANVTRALREMNIDTGPEHPHDTRTRKRRYHG